MHDMKHLSGHERRRNPAPPGASPLFQGFIGFLFAMLLAFAMAGQMGAFQ